MTGFPADLVAVVDDDPSVLEAIGNLLESAGYVVSRFESAEAFLMAIHATLFACVISDIGLPGMSGCALQAEVGRMSPLLPVILITGRDDVGNEGALAANNRGLFRKPFDGEQLLSALAAALEPLKPSSVLKSG
jgi:FixJ family two-component response regulator